MIGSMFLMIKRYGMNKEELHELVSESKGNEKNICQIYAIKDGKPVYED